MANPMTIAKKIKKIAVEQLELQPEGLRYSELCRKIIAFDPTLNKNTVGGSIWNLDTEIPEQVYKPSRGLFRLLSHKPPESESPEPEAPEPVPVDTTVPAKPKEEDFYPPFSEWLVKDIEDATAAISLGGNKFRDKWGTPDVIGKREPGRRDLIKGATEIISAEIKTETQQLVTAFGQACAYKLFSHKVYLVIPAKSADEEISRVDSLCQIFGIGLVLFDADAVDLPDFRILVRPVRHEPDLYYTNKYMQYIEKELFS